MSRQRAAWVLSTLIAAAGFWFGCERREVAAPIEAADSLTPALSSPAVQSSGTESSASGLRDLDSFSVFPAFMPPVAFGGDLQECELGSDPYSTCI